LEIKEENDKDTNNFLFDTSMFIH